MNTYYLNWPLSEEEINKLKVYDCVYLSGTIYTARDAAHKKIMNLINGNEKLPFSLKNACIYYTGPSPTIPGMIVGSIGPTTSKRMDAYAALLYNLGVKATIGKGERNQEVINSIKTNKALYFVSTGGTGALLSQKVMSMKCIAFEELGPESVYELKIKDFPLLVGIDSEGHTIF